MEKNYRKIEFGAGDRIEEAIKYLHSFNGELVYGEFNGQKLYSDTDSLDSAYKKITGKTKSEYDAEMKAENERYQEEQRKHKEAIPQLTKEWIAKGNNILAEKYREKWAKCVPIRLDDLYQGMELGNCLEIVDQLNKGYSFDTVKPIIGKQGHSGMSFGLVCSMVKSFCDRGDEFVAYVR